MSAALDLHAQSYEVSVFEASRNLGGRARGIKIKKDGREWQIDNGQHILIGAYRACLERIRHVGLNPEDVFLRLPLDMRNVRGEGLYLPDCSAPFNIFLGIVKNRAWAWSEKLALLRWARYWQKRKFLCSDAATVFEICNSPHPPLPDRILRDLVDPLCISALNTPIEQASASVFLRVLHDGLFVGKGGSDFLISRLDMSSLFPARAGEFLLDRGAQIHLGKRVKTLASAANGAWFVDGQSFDVVVLSAPSHEAARLIAPINPAWSRVASGLRHNSIATVYAYSQKHSEKNPESASDFLLPAPMVALQDGGQIGRAQFAFDHGRISGQNGLIAFVVSLGGDALQIPEAEDIQQAIQARVLTQAAQQLELKDLIPIKTLIDKRATFACTPQMQALRPPSLIAPNLWARADYVAGVYPATLEGAVRCYPTI